MARTTQIHRARRDAAKIAPRTCVVQPTTPNPERQQPYQYPGINVDLRHLLRHWTLEPGVDYYRVGCFEVSGTHSETQPIMVREVAMTLLMDRLTDKPGWHEKVFDEEIVAKWKQEALRAPEDDIWNSIITDQILQNLEEIRQVLASGDPDEIEGYLWHYAYYPQKPARQRIISEQAFDYVCILFLIRVAAWYSYDSSVLLSFAAKLSSSTKVA